MLYAVIARAPVWGGSVAKFDAAEALKIKGVRKVVEIPGTPLPSAFQPKSGVAVIARDTWTALKARDALKIEWKDGEHGSYDSAAYRAELEAAMRKPGKVLREAGLIDGERRGTWVYYRPIPKALRQLAALLDLPPSSTT